jgi:hypothetical protein
MEFKCYNLQILQIIFINRTSILHLYLEEIMAEDFQFLYRFFPGR